MKIAIVGTGAMGSIYAGMLANSGNEVWAIDTCRTHLNAIKENGLLIEGKNGQNIFYDINTSQNVASIDPCDLYIIATKATAVKKVAPAIKAAMRSDSIVLTMQNGLGSADLTAKYINKKNILAGVADGFGASITGPGRVYHNAMNLIRLGELDNAPSERLEKLISIWQAAGFRAKAYTNINQLIWEKFVCNVSFSGPCTTLYCSVRELMEHSDSWEIALRCGVEAYEIGLAKGVIFTFDDPVNYITSFGTRMPDAKPSMLVDHLASRPSEIEFINGMVSYMGKKLGLPTPMNDTISAIIRFREKQFDNSLT